MTPEQLKRLEEIKRRVYGRDCEKAYDKIHADRNWLIARLEAEAKDNERLDRLFQSLTPGGSEFVHDPDRCVAFVQEARASEMRAFKAAVERKQKAERRAEALEAENGRLREALKAARDLYDRLSVETDPLACAAKYGPDYDQPSPEEWTAMCLEIRGKIDAALTPPQPPGKEESRE